MFPTQGDSTCITQIFVFTNAKNYFYQSTLEMVIHTIDMFRSKLSSWCKVNVIDKRHKKKTVSYKRLTRLLWHISCNC